MGTKFVARATYVQPDGVGWVTKDGRVTSCEKQAQIYDYEADAWLHLTATGLLGSDEKGDWAWVEKIETP